MTDGMSMFKAMDISASGLTAQRFRMDVIAENIANMDTTRTENGEPYRRRVTVFEQQPGESFSSYLSSAASDASGGVRVAGVVEDPSALKLEYDPENPDANEEGYVEKPNVDVVTEMVDMISASRSYEANVTAINASKDMCMKALEIGR
mgnify:CR=1 FL=1